MQSTVWEVQYAQTRIARIYHSAKKHVHCHPTNKTIGKHWIVEFESAASYKSPLMYWNSATTDTFAKTKVIVGSLSAAVQMCESMGWGYDVLYPQNRWHTKKSYADNFIWKGQPTETPTYD